MTTADGYITIDTRIDQKGFNAGVKKLGSSLTGILNIVKGIGKAMVAAFVGGSIISAIRGIVGSFDFLKSSIGDKFKPLTDSLSVLKGTFINLIATAIVPLIPYIVTAVQWFTQLLSTVTQLVAALFGVKKTMGGIASQTEKTTKATEKNTKATRGALAAFDQINVLQEQQSGNVAESASEVPFITPEAMDVPQSFFDKLEEIKKKIMEIKNEILEWWNDPIGKLKETWGRIVMWFQENVFTPLAEWWKNTWLGETLSLLWENFKTTWGGILANTIETFGKIKARVIQFLTGIGEFVVGVFTGNWALAWQGLKDIAFGAFGAIWEYIKGAMENLSLLFEGWKRHVIIIWNALPQPIKDAFNNVLNWIKSTWGAIAEWFRSSVAEPIRNTFLNAANGIRDSFFNALNSIRDGFVNVFNNILNFVSDIVNGIASRIQNMIDLINSIGNLFNGAAPTYYNAPISTYGFDTGTVGGGYRPPHLASGAVIPPNAKFAAILGDQKSGMNIEAPADLIRQIVMDALNSNQQQTNVQVTFEGTLGALVRELQPHIKAENTRTGDKLK